MPTLVERRLAMLERMAGKYAPKIGDLFGRDAVMPTAISSTRNFEDGRLAEAVFGGGITFKRSFLKNADKADLRGALIHEMTHVAGVGSKGGAKRVENMADYARYTLNPNETEGWRPNAAVRRIAERRGTTVAGPGSNRTGTNRNRNTGINNRSHSTVTPYGQTAGTPAPADPGSYGAYAATMAGLQQQLGAAQALARMQVGNAYADRRNAITAAKAAVPGAIAATEGDASARGIVGSSVDATNRGSVLAEEGAAKQAAIYAAQQAIGEARIGQAQAVGQFYTGQGEAAAQLANAQAMQNIQRYQNDAFDVYQHDLQALRQDVLRRIRRNRRRDGDGQPPAPYAPYDTSNPQGPYGSLAKPYTLVNGQWVSSTRTVGPNNKPLY